MKKIFVYICLILISIFIMCFVICDIANLGLYELIVILFEIYFLFAIPAISILFAKSNSLVSVRYIFCICNVLLSFLIVETVGAYVWLYLSWSIIWGAVSIIVFYIKKRNKKGINESVKNCENSSVQEVGFSKIILFKHWFLPLLNMMLGIGYLLFIYFIYYDLIRDIFNDGWGAAILVLPLLIMYPLVITPIITYEYSKMVCSCGEMKYIYCTYNALLTIVPSYIMLHTTGYGWTLFIWVFLWEIIPIISSKLKERKKKMREPEVNNDMIVFSRTDKDL